MRATPDAAAWHRRLGIDLCIDAVSASLINRRRLSVAYISTPSQRRLYIDAGCGGLVGVDIRHRCRLYIESGVLPRLGFGFGLAGGTGTCPQSRCPRRLGPARG
jgi:hypothetical protein